MALEGTEERPGSLESTCAGRTVQVVSDLSPEEQLQLYERARRLKLRYRGGSSGAPPLCDISETDMEPVGNDQCAVYLLFMEGSTRTKDSLRNAAEFHRVKVNEFNAETSSFQKSETITDTIKMLMGYSLGRTVFAIRSKWEGTCRWLEHALPEIAADTFGVPAPAFINAGDGDYSHPTLEYIDVFSILEHLQWDRSSVHIALVGDLFHSRSAASKCDGLRIFRLVKVDLIAPDGFKYPVEYRDRMRANGFEVREFRSIEEYLSGSGDAAGIWYFARPQWERAGEDIRTRQEEFRVPVTFRSEFVDRLPEGVCFFQTMPRDKVTPLLPLAFDDLPLNGWDRTAGNGYFVNTALLGMLFGARCRENVEAQCFKSLSPARQRNVSGDQSSKIAIKATDESKGNTSELPGWIEQVALSSPRALQAERAKSGAVVPIADGIVVDHVGRGDEPGALWQRLQSVREALEWCDRVGAEGVYLAGGGGHKGIISLPGLGMGDLSVPQLKVLASVAPGCTVNAIEASHVLKKYRLHVPERIYDLPNIVCRRSACISHPKNGQRDVVAAFERVPFYETSALGCDGEGSPLSSPGTSEFLFVCKWCRWPHQYNEIWRRAGA